MTNSCKFDKEWTTRTNNNSWNHKDSLGAFMIFLIIAFLSGVFLTVSNYRKPFYPSIAIISLSLLIYIIYNDSVTVLYPFSSLITLSTSTPEFLDKDVYFPKGKLFEESFDSIRNELDTFLVTTNDGSLVTETANTYGGTNKAIGSGGDGIKSWRLFQIKVLGTILPGAIDTFPTVVRLLEECDDVVACAVSILEPNVIIPSHVGYMKGVVRYMFPLKIPVKRDDCFLCVNKKKYSWTEGQGVVWDDTYPHMVENNTDETRVVLYMDVKRVGMSGFSNKLCDLTQWIVKQSPIIKTQMSVQEKQISRFL
jgi:aspartyl/asparaginyl beta-hydroxylase (cupin superfamily)